MIYHALLGVNSVYPLSLTQCFLALWAPLSMSFPSYPGLEMIFRFIIRKPL